MTAPRITLLLAAGLLVAAELVSLSLLLEDIGERQMRRTSGATERAMRLLPQVADWARSRAARPNDTLDLSWIEPFETLAIEDPSALKTDDDQATQRRLEMGELIVDSRITDRILTVRGSVKTDSGPIVFRLTETSTETVRLATEGYLVAQHALILLASLIAIALTVLSRGATPAPLARALPAYEEAMARLRVRDDERVATFDREKQALTSVLRDREAMARAGELTAGIVHEVRNSIGAIAMQAKFAEGSKDERIRSSASLIGDEVRTLQTVMTRFLDFIRTEKVQDEEFDLSRLVERVVAREKTNQSAHIETDGVETIVRGDEELLERAIENVVRNACQASSESGRVLVRFGANEAHAFVMVEDEGSGIADVKKALRPFESGRVGGLGLGLPLVLKILTLHHGTLDLVPRPAGKGTQAVCRWPQSTKGATSGNEKTQTDTTPDEP